MIFVDFKNRLVTTLYNVSNFVENMLIIHFCRKAIFTYPYYNVLSFIPFESIYIYDLNIENYKGCKKILENLKQIE